MFYYKPEEARMKTMKTICLLAVFLSNPIVATTQSHLKTETEAGTDGKGNSYLSQYVFYNKDMDGRKLGLSASARYSNAEKSLHRWEFAFGPNWHSKKASFDSYFGGTTDGKLMLATAGSMSLPKGLAFVGISDPKFPVKQFPSLGTWYSIVWIGRGHYQFRWEGLRIKKSGLVFGRVGPELRHNLASKKIEIYVNPYYDIANRKRAFVAGIRTTLK